MYAWPVFSNLFYTFVLSLSLDGASSKKFVSYPYKYKQESCAIAKITARCALYK